MIALLLIWSALFFASFSMGRCLLQLAGDKAYPVPGDRILLSVWLGYLFISIFLVAVSLLMPLQGWMAFALLALATALTLLVPVLREEWRALYRSARGTDVFLYAAIVTACAIVSAKYITNRDAISYHFDIVTWLASVGSQPGMALIHNRFANISTWYMIPALCNHGPLLARVGTLGNGFALALITCHLYHACLRIALRQARAADTFMAIATPLSIFFPLLLNYTLSPSPDFGVIVLTLFVLWCILIHMEYGIMSGRAVCVPLFLGAAAVSVKLSALPILFVAGCLYAWYTRLAWKALLAGALVVGACLLPTAAADFVVSGCPFYPIPWCIDTPWSVGVADAIQESKSIMNHARWNHGEKTLEVSYLSWAWLKYWLPADTQNIAAFAYFILSLLAGLWIVLKQRFLIVRCWPVLAMGVTGILLLVVKVPDPRFGWAYLAALPALALMPYLKSPSRPTEAPRYIIALVIMLICILPNFTFSTRSEKTVHRAKLQEQIDLPEGPHLLLPPVIPLLKYDSTSGIISLMDHATEASKGGPFQRPMFYPLVPRQGIAYRHPQLGSAGGFIRTDEPLIRYRTGRHHERSLHPSSTRPLHTPEK